MILAGDVGGTKTALALFEERGRGQAVVRESVTASHGYASLEHAIRQFLLEGPPATIDASRDHAEVKRTVDQRIDESRDLIAQLESTGVSMKEVTDKLLVEGLASFSKSFDSLIAGLEKKRGLVGAGSRV